MRITVLLSLILCNAIWATNPFMGKLLLRDFPPLHVAWIRYFSAFVTAVLAILILSRKKSKLVSDPRQILDKRVVYWLLLMALCTFLLSPLLQYTGLAKSTSTANTLIVAMEPLFAALLAWALIGEPWKKIQGVAFFFALCGFLLLSNLKPGDWSSVVNFQVGNLFFLATMPMEAIYSVVSRKIEGKVGALTLYLAASTIGFALLTLCMILSGSGLPNLFALSSSGFLAMLWMGPLGTAITYIYWTIALERASVAAVSLTLFVQPILGAVVGALFLQEVLTGWQFLGAMLILAALSFETLLEIKKGNKHVANH